MKDKVKKINDFEKESLYDFCNGELSSIIEIIEGDEDSKIVFGMEKDYFMKLPDEVFECLMQIKNEIGSKESIDDKVKIVRSFIKDGEDLIRKREEIHIREFHSIFSVIEKLLRMDCVDDDATDEYINEIERDGFMTGLTYMLIRPANFSYFQTGMSNIKRALTHMKKRKPIEYKRTDAFVNGLDDSFEALEKFSSEIINITLKNIAGNKIH